MPARSTASPTACPASIADRYADTIVLQLSSAGAERWREAIVAALARGDQLPRACYERSDADVRTLEGLSPAHRASLHGALPDRRDVRRGRARLPRRRRHRPEDRVLSRPAREPRRSAGSRRGQRNAQCFCYTGGFTLAALAGGAARVVSIDSSAEALALARENLALNPSLPADRAQWCEADAFAELRKLRDRGASFDLIVLDPPKFAPTAAHAERAARAYKDVNLLALKLLRPGGLLATFSCSGGIDAEPLPQDRRRRGAGRGCRRHGHRHVRRGRRPSSGARVSRRRLPQGTCAAQDRVMARITTR